jgi:hypothetical protein
MGAVQISSFYTSYEVPFILKILGVAAAILSASEDILEDPLPRGVTF